MTKTAETKIAMRREHNTLRAVNDYGLEKVLSIPHGEIVTARWTFDRSRKQNAYYWTLISLVWQNLDHVIFRKPENFHVSLKAMLGEFDEVWLPAGAEIVDSATGEVIRTRESTRFMQVGSTAFARMDRAAFGSYLDRVVDLIIIHWMPGATRKSILAEVTKMIGITYEEVTK